MELTPENPLPLEEKTGKCIRLFKSLPFFLFLLNLPNFLERSSNTLSVWFFLWTRAIILPRGFVLHPYFHFKTKILDNLHAQTELFCTN